ASPDDLAQLGLRQTDIWFQAMEVVLYVRSSVVRQRRSELCTPVIRDNILSVVSTGLAAEYSKEPIRSFIQPPQKLSNGFTSECARASGLGCVEEPLLS